MDAENPIVIIAGTRPEIIKLAPVYRSLKKNKYLVEFWMTGQHSTLAQGPADFFNLGYDVHWKLLKKGQNSNTLLSKLISKIDLEITKKRPCMVVVQGDTTTALAGALAAFHREIPVAHVEAGLRSGDLQAPFPEEMNRRVIDVIASLRFPPTALSQKLLLNEGHRGVSEPTGNTGIDALHWAREKIKETGYWPKHVPKITTETQLILSTGHRRENLGEPLKRILTALAEEVKGRPNTLLIHVAHPNPRANQSAHEALDHCERTRIVPPLNYPDFVALLDRTAVIVSDSGGIQEEAPSFGIPILITRDVTERPEVLECRGYLVGTDPLKLKSSLDYALQLVKIDDSLRQTPFGDGKASDRIVEKILNLIDQNNHTHLDFERTEIAAPLEKEIEINASETVPHFFGHQVGV